MADSRGASSATVTIMRAGLDIGGAINVPLAALKLCIYAEYMRACHESAALYASHDQDGDRNRPSVNDDDEEGDETTIDDLRRALRRETLDPNGTLARLRALLDYVNARAGSTVVPRLANVPGLDETTVHRVMEHYAAMEQLVRGDELHLVSEVLLDCLVSGTDAGAALDDVRLSRQAAQDHSNMDVGADEEDGADEGDDDGDDEGGVGDDDDEDDDYDGSEDSDVDDSDEDGDDVGGVELDGDDDDDECETSFCEPSACECDHCRSMIACTEQWRSWNPSDAIDAKIKAFVEDMEASLIDDVMALLGRDEDSSDGGDETTESDDR